MTLANMILSLLTYNIHKGFSTNNRNFVLHQIRDQLRSINVDVVLLQEVIGEHIPLSSSITDWPASTQFEFLADEVWQHYAYGKNAIADDRHHGNATLSKFPFTAWNNINVSPFKRASRSLLHGDIYIPDYDKTVHIINLHLGLFGFERKKQMAQLNSHLESALQKHHAVIIGGDFNDWTSSQVSKLLDPAHNLEEAFFLINGRFARTFPAKWPLLCMDRIYFRGMKLESCECLVSPPWNELSDHIPLLARFNLS